MDYFSQYNNKNNNNKSKIEAKFTLPSHWEPTWEQIGGEVRELIRSDIQTFHQFLPRVQGGRVQAEEEREIIRELQKNRNIVIKPADKGSKIVIMDKQQYVWEAHRQLANTKYYKPIRESLQKTSQNQIYNIINRLYYQKYITAKQRDFLFGPTSPRERQFYLLPKIHKEPGSWPIPHLVPSGRPIVSDCSSVTYNVSMYIDYFLGPLSTKHPSYLKDTYHFLEIIRERVLPSNALLFTIDIESLYTNINTDLGLNTVQNVFRRNPDAQRPDEEILQLLELCLRCNDFQFNGSRYLQIEGTAMGHRYAPSYANLYMSEWETGALEKCRYKPIFYLRFLDDIIGAWTHSKEEFVDFINVLNSHHASIKVKYILDLNEVNFLDTTVFFEQVNEQQKKILTRVYFKPTDTHALLHKASYHPKHTFRGIVKSQIIRFYRISSRETDLQKSITVLFQSLRRRGYSDRFLRAIKRKTLMELRSRSERLTSSRVTEQERVGGEEEKEILPLITMYSIPYLPLNSTFKMNFNSLLADREPFHNCRVITANRKNKNLREMLVRTKLGGHWQGRKRSLEQHFLNPRQYLFNPHGGAGAPILERFRPTSKNIVYCIICKQCSLIYVGETGQTLAERLKQHLYSIGEGRLHTPLVQHFHVHPLNSLGILGIQSCATWTEGQRRRHEELWIGRLNSRFPYGLNLR